MSMYPDSNTRRVPLNYATDDSVTVRFFNTVYAWMSVGLALTAVVSYLVWNSPLAAIVYANPFVPVALVLGAFALGWYVQSAIVRLTAPVAIGLFLLYASIIGAAISYVWLYDLPILGAAFLMTGGVFALMSFYGFITKRDLSGIGSILIMCAIGLFAASIVNVFLASNMLSWIITYAVLAVFIGITAYQTQRLKLMAQELRGQPELAARVAIVGSLVLYIAFINMFISILRILGDRR